MSFPSWAQSVWDAAQNSSDNEGLWYRDNAFRLEDQCTLKQASPSPQVDTGGARTTVVVSEPGGFLDQASCCRQLACRSDGPVASGPCKGQTCPDGQDTALGVGGSPPKEWSDCSALKGQELKDCCFRYDMFAGKPRSDDPFAKTNVTSDAKPYPDVCIGVNKDFKPDQPQTEPVGPGQPMAYCQDFLDQSMSATDAKFAECQKLCAETASEADARKCHVAWCNPDFGIQSKDSAFCGVPSGSAPAPGPVPDPAPAPTAPVLLRTGTSPQNARAHKNRANHQWPDHRRVRSPGNSS